MNPFDLITEDNEKGTLTCTKCGQVLSLFSVTNHNCTKEEDITF